jgi:hypothetical protein
MHAKDADLIVSIPVDGEDAEGMGNLEDVELRHQLAATVDQLLRGGSLGHVDGEVVRAAATRSCSWGSTPSGGRRPGRPFGPCWPSGG